MTKGEAIRSMAVNCVLAVASFGVGAYAVYLALGMVSIFGEGMGIDARSREIYAETHRVIHIGGTISAILISIFYNMSKKLLTTVAVAGMVCCGGWGIVNMIGFTSTNRVSVAAAREAGNTATEREYQAARSDLQNQIKWAQDTSEQETGREKRRLLAYVDAKRKELSALKAPRPTAQTVLADPQASTFSKLITSIGEETWLVWLPVPVAFLLFFTEVTSFIYAVNLLFGAGLAWAAWRAARLAEADRKTHPGSAGSGGEPKKPTLVHPAEPAKPAAKIRAEPSYKPSSAGSRVSTDAPRGKLTYEQFVDTIRHDMAHGDLASSTRALAHQTRWSQTSVVRQARKLKDKANTRMRRFDGNGGGRHVSAMG